MKYKFRRLVGWFLYKLGRNPHLSSNIAECLSAGYGDLDDNGFWQYPAPDRFWIEYYGYKRLSNRNAKLRTLEPKVKNDE